MSGEGTLRAELADLEDRVDVLLKRLATADRAAEIETRAGSAHDSERS